MKSNIHRKLTFEDKWVRFMCCKNRARRYTRYTKLKNNRKFRKILKKEVQND